MGDLKGKGRDKFDEDLERTQEQMRTLVAATGEDIKQQAAVEDLEAAV